MSDSKPAVLLFGSLSLSFDEKAFQQLHHWAWETLTCLPHSYQTIVAAVPALESASTLEHLHDLKKAVQRQQPLTIPFPLPNSALIPLVVVFQLTQYADMVEDATIDLDPRVDLFAASIHGQETLGFCTGLLSAITVSSARNKEQFCHFAAVAARLGLLVGMVVDACDAASLGPSRSLIAAWSLGKKENELHQILQAFPEIVYPSPPFALKALVDLKQAYLSVYYDEDRATVTTAASTLSPLLEQCRAAGILAAEVGLFGRFHSDAHSNLLPAILDFCDAHPSFQFPDASELVIPTQSNAGGAFIHRGFLHRHALQQILIDPPQWFAAVDTVRKSRLQEDDAHVVSFGTERCIPPSLMRTVGQKVIQAPVPGSSQAAWYTDSGNEIAVVGMACKTAGADNLEEFWDLLCAGESQHKEVPKERFGFETVFRDVDHKRKWFGNFINGHDEFDHKFFKKSPRESATMASRALGSPKSSHFQSINIICDNGWNNLVDATLSLWKAGLGVQFWAHQSSQTKEHPILLLPPYQFERSKHWIELKTPPRITSEEDLRPKIMEQDLPEKLFKFVGYEDKAERQARFRINTLAAEYDELLRGHVIAQTAPICPATIQLDIVIEAVRSIKPAFSSSKLEPRLYNVENASPLCINLGQAVWVEAVTEGSAATTWNFQVFSNDLQNEAPRTVHTTGQIVFQSVDDLALKLEFARLERHFSHEQCLDILRSNDPDEVLQSRNIHKIFAEIVHYGEEYRGLQKLVSKGNQSADLVAKQYNPESWLDGHLADSFCQVGGICVSCMVDRTMSDMYIANGVEQWIRSPRFHQQDSRPDSYHVLATHHRPSPKAFLTDVFIFNPTNDSLIEAILSISYVRVPKASISRLLSRLAMGDFQKVAEASTSEPFHGDTDAEKKVLAVPQAQVQRASPSATIKVQAPGKLETAPKVKTILAELSGLELKEIKDDKLAHEIEAAFQITIPENELMDVIDIPSLMKCVGTVIGGGVVTATESSDQSTSENEESDTKPSGYTTPSTASEVAEPAKSVQNTGLNLSFCSVIEAFNEVKSNTDDHIVDYKQGNYFETVLPLKDQMCVSLVLEAFDKLGQHIRNANPGDKFVRIEHAREHARLVDHLYRMLDEGAGLVNIDGDCITRTAVLPPCSSSEILAELATRFPDQSMADELTLYTGSQLAEVLRGQTDGIKLIFGTPKGRDLVFNMYAEWPLNRLFYRQMEGFISRLVSKVDMAQGAIKILEMGAGTGGTTRWLVPLLAELNISVEYTFTDLAPSFVAAARKRFGKQYPFMKFRTHDIEQAPADDLLGTQHIIIASNAVHATHSLRVSASNIRKALRSDGLLMVLEMTSIMYWVDVTFGLFEGWWYFDDERTHAVTHESQWETELHSAGYGHVDWTDGARPEDRLEKLIIAFASGGRYLRKMTAGWKAPSVKGAWEAMWSKSLPAVLLQSLRQKGIWLPDDAIDKLTIMDADLARPQLGLSSPQYESLVSTTTHIIHNAWLMNAKWPLDRFESQLYIMRNLLDFASAVVGHGCNIVTFQFISSIATVGHYPLHTGRPRVPEAMMGIESVLPTGYGDAKYICELMLESTLRLHPDKFHAMTVRPGQIAGSSESGYWNPREHFSFVIKSSQTLGALPRFEGLLSWAPVDFVAGTTVDLLFRDDPPYPVYHIENPIRQRWENIMPVLADELHLPQTNIIPFSEWVQRVREYSRHAGSERENPAIMLVDFLDENFLRISCGGLLLETRRCREHSKTLADMDPVSEDVTGLYIKNWRAMEFLD
ncbi:uncharacterized protein BO72DRAFT_500986 [Aspergillus fijiensis CBS 313.89]|uniref:PKS/mFAS DH domain-containing protein n=1 Tax=Aspergillus fijiensis CBS 313.89 TaxID=1448319 RepID=A0A8G1RFJ5_9EURO|nr:uncharacterized protein BO72DRAFT_500986 [Aspergillus fijiensis CBS 313.89]RAK72395.1 hypothetical protein BO72DRAFT_500986 [Aspergillus fijiensis CBS 313.89]